MKTIEFTVLVVVIIIVGANFTTRKQGWIVYCIFVRRKRRRLNERRK